MRTLAALLVLCGVVLAEVVHFEPCPVPTENEPAPAWNCTVHEVRISPCAEASLDQPCKIKRGRSASIQFDFTAGVDSTNLTGRAYWANPLGDMPFLGMNTEGCSFTTCPVRANVNQTYDYQLSISKKFPVRAYDVKWRLWNEEANLFECCFIAKIKLVK